MDATVNERIKILSEMLGYRSIRAFAAKIGMAQTSLNAIVNGTEPKYSTLFKILSKEPLVNPEWLMMGMGNMLNSSTQNDDAVQCDISNDDTSLDREIHIARVRDDESVGTPVCLYDVSAAAGYGNFDEMIKNERIIDKFIIPSFRDVSWMIYVNGMSMYPKYSSGDIIACRVLNESKFIQWGKVYVVATREQGLLVKRLKKSESDDYITAVSDNEMYAPFDIPKDEIFGIALVVGVIRLE